MTFLIMVVLIFIISRRSYLFYSSHKTNPFSKVLYPAVEKIILKNYLSKYFPQTDEGIITKVPTQTPVFYP
jgi:hypothetical protein